MLRKQRKIENLVTELKSQYSEFQKLESEKTRMKPFGFLRLTLLYHLVSNQSFEDKLNFLNPQKRLQSEELDDFNKNLDRISPLQMVQYKDVGFLNKTGDDILYKMWGNVPAPGLQEKLKLFSFIKQETENLRKTREEILLLKLKPPEEVHDNLIFYLNFYKSHFLKIREVKAFRDILVENCLFETKAFTFTRNGFFYFIIFLDWSLELYIQHLFFFAKTYGYAFYYFQELKKYDSAYDFDFES